MGKKRGKEDRSVGSLRARQAMTLREEKTGVQQQASLSSILRMQHLQRLAIWSGGEGGVPPLGALFGHHLAASAEAVGKPLDSALVLCQRCETILQPGFNCTVRIEKNVKKAKRRKKSRDPFRNNVVYTCHFCSYRNLKAGTRNGHMKDLLSLRPKPDQEIETHFPPVAAKERVDQNEQERVPSEPCSISYLKSASSPEKAATEKESLIKTCPTTPLVKLTDAPKKKMKEIGSAPGKPSSSEKTSIAVDSGKSTGGSSKRRRKAWSTLKEIAEDNELKKKGNITNFAIPFLI